MNSPSAPLRGKNIDTIVTIRCVLFMAGCGEYVCGAEWAVRHGPPLLWHGGAEPSPDDMRRLQKFSEIVLMKLGPAIPQQSVLLLIARRLLTRWMGRGAARALNDVCAGSRQRPTEVGCRMRTYSGDPSFVHYISRIAHCIAR